MKAFNIIALFIVLLASSCSKESSIDINGTYQRTIQIEGQYFEVKLTFTTDGKLEWNPVSEIPNHSASVVNYVLLSGKQFRITGDDDCGSEAVYDFVLNNNVLTLSSTLDSCDARHYALAGEWVRLTE